MKKIILVLFLVCSVGELFSIVADSSVLHSVCKPLLMILLGAFYVISVSSPDRSTLVMLALLLSCVGDILLMLAEQEPDYFLPGLGAFLIAHICYIFSYRQHRSEGSQDRLQGIHQVRLGFPIVLAVSGLVVILYPVLGALRIPVILYAAVILMMALNALFRYGRTTSASFWMVMAGALLFMFSDSMIAINKFLEPIKNASLWIMTLYITGQFLIVQGLIKHPPAAK